MVSTSMFSQSSSFVGVVFWSNSCIDDRGGGGASFVGWGRASFAWVEELELVVEELELYFFLHMLRFISSSNRSLHSHLVG